MRAIIIIGDHASLCRVLSQMSSGIEHMFVTPDDTPAPVPDESRLDSMQYKIAAIGEELRGINMYKTSDVELPKGRIESPRWRKGRNTALNRIIR